MRRASGACLVLTALVIATGGASRSLSAQAPAQAPAQMGKDEISAFAKVHIAIAQAHDSIDAQLAQPRNKTRDAQKQLQDKLRSQIDEILHHSGMTQEEYQRKTYVVSTDVEVRKTFDGIVAQLTGVPTPGQVQATAGGRGPAVPVPAGAVGTHIGHVVNQFGDTPDGMGLLPAALAEARIASQHATLGARNPANLDGMKLHAGHVIHALDPTVVTTGPGRGYGVKRAATGVATHIELAAKAQGASQNVIAHSAHIAMSARNSVQRADQIIALAKQIQAATTAAEAAALMSQLVSQCDQLVAGADINGDGKITWEQGEGGLQQVQEHVNLMLASEMKTPD